MRPNTNLFRLIGKLRANEIDVANLSAHHSIGYRKKHLTISRLRSIITLMIIRENKIIDQFPTPKHQQIWLPF